MQSESVLNTTKKHKLTTDDHRFYNQKFQLQTSICQAIISSKSGNNPTNFLVSIWVRRLDL